MTTPAWTPRKQTLTEEDIRVIESMVRDLIAEQHLCKINVTHEEMDDIKRVAKFFTVAESTIIKTVSKAILWGSITIIGGVFWLLYQHGYFFKGGK